MKTCIEQLKDFLESDHKNLWLDDGEMKRYVRKGVRNVDGRLRTTLELASAEVSEENQRKGMYDAFNKVAEEINPYEVLFIENVLYLWLRDYYVGNGFIQIPFEFYEVPICLYKINPNSKIEYKDAAMKKADNEGLLTAPVKTKIYLDEEDNKQSEITNDGSLTAPPHVELTKEDIFEKDEENK